MSVKVLRPIEHYPADLIDVWHATNGVRYLMRPVLPQDHRPLGDLIVRLSRTSRYRRFHGSIRELSQETLAQMTSIDYRQHMAFVVTKASAEGEMVVADARYSVDATGDAAEFSVVVDDASQRRGLGLRTLRALDFAAARDGVRWLHGAVLFDNEPMLALMKRCDFSLTPDREEPSLMRAEKLLSRRSTGLPTDDVSRWRFKLFGGVGSRFSFRIR